MTIRNDITVDYSVSPRIVTVAIPSVALAVQDLHDTLTGIEDSREGGQHPRLILTAGGEDLGSGVTVGLTATMQNAQIAFEARTVPLVNSTATANDVTGVTLTDTAGSFQTNLVGRGDIVFNITDGSAGTVISVEDESNLTMQALTGGADNEWAVNDIYKIYDEVQCEISGGNLVSVDDVGVPIDAVFPTFGTQVVRTSSSSATLQELQDIQYSSFGGGVTVDTVNGVPGTIYPTGTPRQPCDNLTDALLVSASRGFPKFFIIGNITVPIGPDFSNKTFEGESEGRSLITIPAAASVNDCEYTDAEITGTLDGNSAIMHCAIGTLAFVNGIIIESGLKDATITLGGSAQASLIDCHSLVAGTNAPVIDFGGSGQSLILRNYSGGVTLQNKAGTEDCSLDFISGQVTIADTVDGTGGITLRGFAKWANETTYLGDAPVTNELIEAADLREIWKLLGLDPSDKITITPSGVSTELASFTITFTGDGITSTTMDRTA